jgi:hypothetical protein
MQICLKLKAVYEDAERRIRRWVPKILQSRPVPGFGAKSFALQEP